LGIGIGQKKGEPGADQTDHLKKKKRKRGEEWREGTNIGGRVPFSICQRGDHRDLITGVESGKLKGVKKEFNKWSFRFHF